MKKKIPTLEYALYSPDPAPYKFFLFPNVRSYLKENHFQSNEGNHKKTSEILTELSQNDPREYFKAWKACTKLHLASDRKYFDVNNMETQ